MDLTNVEREQTFETVPEGTYAATIELVEKVYSKSNKPMVKTTLSLEGSDSKLFDNTLVEYIDGLLDLFKAKGIDDLQGKKATVEVKHNEQGYANLFIPFVPIDAGEIIKVQLRVKRGDYNNPEKGLTGGLATRNANSGAIYLNCKFTVVEGEHKGKAFFSMIGIHSEKGPIYATIGAGQMKSIVISSNEIEDETTSQAQAILSDFKISDLDSIEFWCVTKIEIDEKGKRNTLGKIICPGMKEWEVMKTFGVVSKTEDIPLDIDKEAESVMTNADRLRDPKKPSWA